MPCALPIQNRHEGDRIFVCGSSPHIHRLPIKPLLEGVCIGINTAPSYFKGMQYLICHDSMNLVTQKGFLNFVSKLPAEKFFAYDAKIIEMHQNNESVLNYVYEPVSDLSKEWCNELMHGPSTAIDACNLAYLMGASEIILYGVDFTGGSRFDGSTYPSPDFWGQNFAEICEKLQKIPVPIYKTNPKSPLPFPLAIL